MSDVKVLNRSEFLKAVNNFKREIVEISIGSVYVAELSTAQIFIYQDRLNKLKLKGKKQVDAKTSVELMALLVSLSVCDEDGNPLFSEADVSALSRAKPEDMITLSVKAMELSGMANDAITEVREQLKKNQNSSSVST